MDWGLRQWFIYSYSPYGQHRRHVFSQGQRLFRSTAAEHHNSTRNAQDRRETIDPPRSDTRAPITRQYAIMLYFKYILWLDHHAPQHIVLNTPLNKYLASYSILQTLLHDFLNTPAGQNGSPGTAPRTAPTIQTATAGRKNLTQWPPPEGCRTYPPRPLLVLWVFLNQKSIVIYITPISLSLRFDLVLLALLLLRLSLLVSPRLYDFV